jgi:HTH-type transcriptional regulator / antitoxin HipB
MDAKDLGVAIRSARKALKLTHLSVSKATGLSVQFLVDLEKGKPSVQMGKAMEAAGFFGIQMQISPKFDERAYQRAARFAAIEKKNAADSKQLEFLKSIVENLQANPADPDQVLARALSQVELWERDRLCSPVYINRWRSALKGGADSIRTQVLGDPVWVKALVQNSPFGFLKGRPKARAHA